MVVSGGGTVVVIAVMVVVWQPVATVVASDLMVVNSGRHKKLNGGTDYGLDGGISVEEMVGVHDGFMVVSGRRRGFVAVHGGPVMTMAASWRSYWWLMRNQERRQRASPVATVVASDLMVVNSGRHKKLNGGTGDGLDGGSSVEEMVGVHGGFMVVSGRHRGFVGVHSGPVMRMAASWRS
ncbi:hypothetical protein L1987_23778 [Smallanthus sonchifolius]|uniref:Uncharacterized protein n=1 Tax=Smallanthus sonchifolius TaxID=185202 RepID=A0ACB9IJX6_9ASTR|nr:hypothetical protein L1987_23778 [Smallanthus sonchifolius]